MRNYTVLIRKTKYIDTSTWNGTKYIEQYIVSRLGRFWSGIFSDQTFRILNKTLIIHN
jgi:hypothetical protein